MCVVSPLLQCLLTGVCGALSTLAVGLVYPTLQGDAEPNEYNGTQAHVL